MVASLFIILAGFVTCFLGLRVFRILLALQGFVVGFVAVVQSFGSDVGAVLAAMVAGLLVAAFFYTVYKAGYVIYGVLLGLVVGLFLVQGLGMGQTVGLATLVIMSVAGGLLGAVLADPLIRLATAVIGAIQLVNGAALLLSDLPLAAPGSSEGDPLLSLIVIAALSVAGFTYQHQNR
jgi:hypothetical protein